MQNCCFAIQTCCFFAVLVAVAVVVVKPPIVDIEGLPNWLLLRWQQNSLTLYPSRDTLAFVDDHQLIALLTNPWSMRFVGGRVTHYGRANGFAQQSQDCLKTKKNKNKINGKWHPIGCTVGNVSRKTQKWNYLFFEALAASLISQRSKRLAMPILQLKVRNVNIKSPQMSPTPFRLSTYHNN